jgi:hypothetical protein
MIFLKFPKICARTKYATSDFETLIVTNYKTNFVATSQTIFVILKHVHCFTAFPQTKDKRDGIGAMSQIGIHPNADLNSCNYHPNLD